MTSPARYTRFCQIHDAVRTLAASHDLGLALADLDHIDPLFLNAAKRQQDARPALAGAQAYDAPSVTGGGSTSSAPERLAMQEDRTQHDRDLLDRLLRDLWTDVRGVILEPDQVCRRITRNTLALRRLIEAWTPRTPTDKQRRSVERLNDAEPECQPCREHANTYELFRTITDVGGILPDPLPLCRWHTDFTARNSRPATPHETQLHHQGRTIRLPVATKGKP